MSEVESLQGKLLIASPSLVDPNFRRTVVLVTEHNDEGAAGLVLNRPSPAPVAEIVPQLEPLVDVGDQVWVGGPVQPNAVLVLGEFLDPDDAAVPLFGSLGYESSCFGSGTITIVCAGVMTQFAPAAGFVAKGSVLLASAAP